MRGCADSRARYRRAAIALTLVAAVLVAPTASARKQTPTLVGPKGHEIKGKWHKWLVESHMPLVRGRVQIVFAGCPGASGYSGCVFSRRPRKLYIRRNARVPRAVLYHELGHTFDLTLLHRKDRRTLRRILHVKRGWFEGSPPPAELFAEAYALCSRFGVKRPASRNLDWTRSQYGYKPSRRQHRAICLRILQAGRAKHMKPPQPPANAPPVFVEPKQQQQPPAKQPGPSLPVPLPPILPLP